MWWGSSNELTELSSRFLITSLDARGFRSVHFPASQQDQVQEPSLVHFAETDFLGMVFDEFENVLLADAMNVSPIPIVSACALKAVLKPTVRDPPGNFVMVFAPIWRT
jgi:hypothetical protein